MTHKPTERRGSSSQFTWLWMMVSVLAVGGFLYWLGAVSEPSGPRVVEEDQSSEMDATGVRTVALDELVGDVSGYVGLEVRLDGIDVASRLGAEAFWTTSSSGIPFLIRIAPSLLEEGFTVEGGDAVTVIGRVVQMSDSVLGTWQQEGVLADENQRMEAEFATGFVEAVRAQKATTPAS